MESETAIISLRKRDEESWEITGPLNLAGTPGWRCFSAFELDDCRRWGWGWAAKGSEHGL